MRSLAGWAIVGGSIAATAAGAQPLPPPASAEALVQTALAQAAFTASVASGPDSPAQFLDEQTFQRAQGPTDWTSGQMRLSDPGASGVSTLHFGVARSLIGPSGLPLAPGQSRETAQVYEVGVARAWRGFGFETRSFGVDFSPHASFGMSSFGGVAEAGGRVELSQRRADLAGERLRALGVRDGARFGDRGRWYLFAAASGRAVGLNMLRSDAGWNRAGWTTDQTSTLVGDAQVGVGWRKGAMQTSLGFVHQQFKNDHLLYGQDSKAESMVAFSFSIRPQARQAASR